MWYTPECYELRPPPWIYRNALLTVIVLTRMRALNSQLPERKILLIPSICILGKSLQDYHFLHLLPTDNRNLTIPGTIAFRPSVKVSWTDLCCEFHHRRQGTEMRPLKLRCYSNVHVWLRTACTWWIAIILSEEQMYQHWWDTLLNNHTMLYETQIHYYYYYYYYYYYK